MAGSLQRVHWNMQGSQIKLAGQWLSCRCSKRRLQARVVREMAHEPAKDVNQLDTLKLMSRVVSDTAEIEQVKLYKPAGCTTNPSILLKAVAKQEYEHFLREAVLEEQADPHHENGERPHSCEVNVDHVVATADRLAVLMGCELLKLVPGRVHTQVDPHLAYDTNATVARALKVVELYKQQGVSQDRVYIKVAATWEGIQACHILQSQGIDCNMTLLFSLAQAIACAQADAAMIAPYVGRVLEWYQRKEGRKFSLEEDPGVASVRRIFNYYKSYGYGTQIMAASFRNIGEIRSIAGCDEITISPNHLEELKVATDTITEMLHSTMAGCPDAKLTSMDGELFREMHEGDQMAAALLTEGITKFAEDQQTIEKMLSEVSA